MITTFIQKHLRNLLGLDCEACKTEARLDKLEKKTEANLDSLVSADQFSKKIYARQKALFSLFDLIQDEMNKRQDTSDEAVASVALASAKIEVELGELKQEIAAIVLETLKEEAKQ